jgi:hypothetical protein
LHDAITAERLGVPAAGVMTTSFETAARLMSRVLGMPEYAFCVIAHPVSSASDAALAAQARATLVDVPRLLLRP